MEVLTVRDDLETEADSLLHRCTLDSLQHDFPLSCPLNPSHPRILKTIYAGVTAMKLHLQMCGICGKCQDLILYHLAIFK